MSWSVDERSLTDAFFSFGTVTEGTQQIRNWEPRCYLGNLGVSNLGLDDKLITSLCWMFGFD